MRKLRLEELGRPDLETYSKADKLPITIVLDNIRSALNVGSIFRTADAMAINDIVLCGITARPPHKEINKTAIGATNSVKWTYENSISAYVQKAKEEGKLILGIEQIDKSVALSDYAVPIDKLIVVILGNEVNGISDEVLRLLDSAIEIPQFGTKHSLNVAVCAGIIMWSMRQSLS